MVLSYGEEVLRFSVRKVSIIFHNLYYLYVALVSVKRDLKVWNIDKDLAMDRCAWKLAIHVPEP
jgi:hypothetical protein